MTSFTMIGARPSLRKVTPDPSRIAVRNARKITDLNAKEEDIIIKHMWGATLLRLATKNPSVTMVDKYWAVKEASEPWRKRWLKEIFSSKMLKS